MLTILICKPFHIKWLTQECGSSVTDCNILSIYSFVAVVLSSWFPDYCISPYALAMKSVCAEWGNIGY